MAFLGKEFKVEKTENVEGLVDSLGLSEDRKEKLLKAKIPRKITKNDDGTYTMTAVPTPYTFKSGEEFEHSYPKFTAKLTITIDGNKVTQVQDIIGNTITVLMEFSDNELVETITSSKWNGTAKVYYKA